MTRKKAPAATANAVRKTSVIPAVHSADKETTPPLFDLSEHPVMNKKADESKPQSTYENKDRPDIYDNIIAAYVGEVARQLAENNRQAAARHKEHLNETAKQVWVTNLVMCGVILMLMLGLLTGALTTISVRIPEPVPVQVINDWDKPTNQVSPYVAADSSANTK